MAPERVGTFVKSLLGLVKPLKGSHFHGDWSRSSIGYLPQQTPAQRDFPASVQEIVRSGFLSKMGMRPFYTRQEKQQAEAAMERLNLIPLWMLLSGAVRWSAAACTTGKSALCSPEAVGTG